MSALPPEPDIAEGGRHVSFGPIADVVFLAVTPRGPQAIFDLYSIFIMPMGFPSGIHMHSSAHQAAASTRSFRALKSAVRS